MLRIILWKLGFEWSNILRVLQPQNDQRIYYFAFGANLSADVLKQRRIEVFETFDFALDDAEIRFSQAGFYKQHGYASADPVAGAKAYGRMLLIRQSDAKRMDYFEGVPFLKVHEKVAQTYNGKPFYFYRAVSPTENLMPTQEYLDYITTAYRTMDSVPESYISEMEKTEVLKIFETPDQTGSFIRDINSWPESLHPFLISYEGICQRVVEFLWNRSAVDWMIKL